MLLYLFKGYSEKFFNEITWYVWENAENECLCNVVEDITVYDLIKHVCSTVPQFLEHCFIKRSQANMYRDQYNEVTKDSFPI